ncbi:hypothetical protein GCM10022247_34690 [Allokutzneria multivorans]|uniref:Phosphoadenosine phosphosulfate reductase n=2 Tax=Allokutzneria multivorans TaxID=1142134 RepID=A0ABP7SBW4_9PSEU
MGIDSVALLVRWLLDPSSRDFDLDDLVVVTAMTGDEHDYTREQMEEYVLPLMREHGVRYVQISRTGQRKSSGYTVLSDSRTTETMVMRGPWWLSFELRTGATMPSIRRQRRWCSERAKGDPLDWWVNDNLLPGYTHVVGFAAEELDRADRDTHARRSKAAAGTTVPCRVEYPLLAWGMDRAACAAYLKDVFKIDFRRSCCTFCPFQATAGSRVELLARWTEYPEACADTLELEYTALAVNPRCGAFGSGETAIDLARRHSLSGLGLARERLARVEVWDVLSVRRVFDQADQPAARERHGDLSKSRNPVPART